MQGGNTVGVDAPRQVRSDGYRHFNTRGTIARLKRLHVNTYVYTVWYQPTDWEDLRTEFLPAARRAGIDVLVYLVPPSECGLPDGQCSKPFNEDYLTWARKIARLSLKYPNLRAWAMDDFFSQLSTDYTAKFTSLAKSINPELGFYITTYYDSAVNATYLDKYSKYIDGIVYPFVDDPYNNLMVADTVGPRMDDVLAKLRPRGLGLILLSYTGRFLSTRREATPAYTRHVLHTALEYAQQNRIDGVISYGTPLAEPPTIRTEHRSMYGDGRLSFFLPRHVDTKPGWHADASQEIKINPHVKHYQLSFWHWDEQQVNGCGYQRKQVLIDGEVIFDHDICDGPSHVWMQANILDQWIDVTKELKGKRTATLTFRLYETKGVGDSPIDVGFDHVQTTGFTVRNPGFESKHRWKLSSNNPALHPNIDIWDPNRPKKLFRTVARQFREVRTTNDGHHR